MVYEPTFYWPSQIHFVFVQQPRASEHNRESCFLARCFCHQAAADCRPVSPSLRREYIDTFGTVQQENELKAAQKKERADKLIVSDTTYPVLAVVVKYLLQYAHKLFE